MKESIARRKKRQPIPKRVSGDGSAPPRFRFGFPAIALFAFPWRVLGCGALTRAAAKHTSRCQMVLFSIKCRMSYLSKIMECIYQPHVL